MSRVPSVGLCGAGMITAAHAAAARALGWRVAWVASRTTASAHRRADPLGARVLSLDAMPADADLVIVATPPADHAGRAKGLLAAGVAVAVEKPLCTTLEQADDLVAAADRAGNRMLYAENLAYAPVIRTMVAAAPTLGPLHHLEVRVVNPRPTWGDFLTEGWGGGALFDLGVHPIAVALLLAAPSRVVAVEAELAGGKDHHSDEHAEVRLRFDSGLVAMIVSSFRGGPEPVWDAQVASATGVLRADLFPTPTLERNGVPLPFSTTSTPGDPVVDFGYAGQLAAFRDDIDAGRAPLMDARFGRDVLDVVCAAYTAAARGRAEPVPFRGARDRTPLRLWR